MSEFTNERGVVVSDESVVSDSLPGSDEVTGALQASRDETIKAVNAAMGIEPEPADAAAPVVDTVVDKVKTEPAKDSTELAVVMRARKQAQAMRDEAQKELDEARKSRQEADSYKAEIEPWRQKLPKLKESPAAILAELGMNPEQFVESLLKEGKPDPVKDVRGQIDELKAQLAELKAERESQKKESEEQAQTSQNEKAKQMFLEVVTGDGTAYPTLNAVYGDDQDELIYRANSIADKYFQLEGKYPSLDEIAQYLETVELKRYNKVHGNPQADSPRDSAPLGDRAKTRKPLSTATASQKAMAPLPLNDMTDTQLRDHLKEVAAKAMREGGVRP